VGTLKQGEARCLNARKILANSTIVNKPRDVEAGEEKVLLDQETASEKETRRGGKKKRGEEKGREKKNISEGVDISPTKKSPQWTKKEAAQIAIASSRGEGGGGAATNGGYQNRRGEKRKKKESYTLICRETTGGGTERRGSTRSTRMGAGREEDQRTLVLERVCELLYSGVTRWR